MSATPTLAQPFERFLEQSNLSPGTLRTYTYAAQHFYAFLEGSRTAQPLSLAGAEPAATRSIRRLGSAPEDVNLLAWFVSYLGREVRNANPKRTKRAARGRCA
jgi:hypothetical protein